MSRWFGFDNPIWNFLGKLTDILFLSLLFLVTSLPVFTIGASMTALYHQMFREAKGTEGYVVRGYLRDFKESMGKTTPVFVCCLLFGGFLVGDLFLCMGSSHPAAKMLLAFFTVLGACFLCLLHYVFPLLAILKTGRKKVLFLSFMLMGKELPKTLFLVFLTGSMICVGVFVSAPFLLIAPGIIAFFHAIVIQGILEKYGLREEEGYANTGA